jgi:hypothetical protein
VPTWQPYATASAPEALLPLAMEPPGATELETAGKALSMLIQAKVAQGDGKPAVFRVLEVRTQPGRGGIKARQCG